MLARFPTDLTHRGETREELEAKQSQASSDPSRKRQALFASPFHGRDKVDEMVVDVEDVYVAQNGSTQCVVHRKSLLVAMENLVGGELKRGCKELFRKRYGHRELQMRAAPSPLSP